MLFQLLLFTLILTTTNAVVTNSPTKSKPPTTSPTTYLPSKSPSKTPSKAPSKSPTIHPSKAPTQSKPSKSPSLAPRKPSRSPTTSFPTKSPSKTPSKAPSKTPSHSPTKSPSKSPTFPPLFTCSYQAPDPTTGTLIPQISTNRNDPSGMTCYPLTCDNIVSQKIIMSKLIQIKLRFNHTFVADLRATIQSSSYSMELFNAAGSNHQVTSQSWIKFYNVSLGYTNPTQWKILAPGYICPTNTECSFSVPPTSPFFNSVNGLTLNNDNHPLLACFGDFDVGDNGYLFQAEVILAGTMTLAPTTAALDTGSDGPFTTLSPTIITNATNQSSTSPPNSNGPPTTTTTAKSGSSQQHQQQLHYSRIIILLLLLVVVCI
jgi:hypothetical protein